jgi:predicted metal-dependent phosphoesterase TrpH
MISKYDLHSHTKYSRCSNLEPGLLLKLAYKRNLDGIAVTDHNTMKGSIAVKKLNKNKDFEVIPASEIKTNMGELLVYYQQEPIDSSDIFEVIDRARQQGCIIAVAHPFDFFRTRFKSDIKNYDIDAIEGFNGRAVLPSFNWQAQALAKKLKKPVVAGSDSHFAFEVGRTYTYFNSELSLRKAIKQNKTRFTGTIIPGKLGGVMSLFRRRN